MRTSGHAALRQEPVWFGPKVRPLFGWVLRPRGDETVGAVVVAPTIGRESVASRRALRDVAAALSEVGFVTLRFDYDGTGDSAGDFEDPGRDEAWLDSVAEASRYVRSFGVEAVSALGMRLGATIVGEAAARRDLELTSLVLWDPCESGRHYLRELSALEGLRKEAFEPTPDGSIETSEFNFSLDMVREVRQLNLATLPPTPLAKRVLVIAREDRALSTKFRQRFEDEGATFLTTSEQANLLEVEPFYSVMPTVASASIVSWLAEAAETPRAFVAPSAPASVVLATRDGLAVRERVLRLGSRDLFAMVSEPLENEHGPVIVLMNSFDDDHTGRARLWVELSRRWAGYGLRCVRLDLHECGESPWTLERKERVLYDQLWIDDVVEAATQLRPSDPSDVVLMGVCSGAFVSVEAGLTLSARGVCAVNVPVAVDYLHYVTVIENAKRLHLRWTLTALKHLAYTHQWICATVAHVLQVLLPKALDEDVMSRLVAKGSDLLVLASVDDLSPKPTSPIFRSIDIRRVGRSTKYEPVFVDGLDHGMHDAQGRVRVVATLDRYVLERFAGVSLPDEFDVEPSEDA